MRSDRFTFQEIERAQLTTLRELQVLDLSRNNIGRLGANTFSDLSSLARLDLSLNVLRTVGKEWNEMEKEESTNGISVVIHTGGGIVVRRFDRAKVVILARQ